MVRARNVGASLREPVSTSRIVSRIRAYPEGFAAERDKVL